MPYGGYRPLGQHSRSSSGMRLRGTPRLLVAVLALVVMVAVVFMGTSTEVTSEKGRINGYAHAKEVYVHAQEKEMEEESYVEEGRNQIQPNTPPPPPVVDEQIQDAQEGEEGQREVETGKAKYKHIEDDDELDRMLEDEEASNANNKDVLEQSEKTTEGVQEPPRPARIGGSGAEADLVPATADGEKEDTKARPPTNSTVLIAFTGANETESATKEERVNVSNENEGANVTNDDSLPMGFLERRVREWRLELETNHTLNTVLQRVCGESLVPTYVGFNTSLLHATTVPSILPNQTKQILWDAFTGKRPNVVIGATGGSSPDTHDTFPFIMQRNFQTLMSLANSSVNVTARVVPHDWADSVWGGTFLDQMIGEDVDFLFWDFSVNDYRFKDEGRGEALELWLRRALQLKPIAPSLGLAYIWDGTRDEEWPSKTTLQGQEDVLKAYAKRHDINRVSLGSYVRALMLAAPNQNTCIKKAFLGENHHPTTFGHQVIANQFAFMYTGVILDMIRQARASNVTFDPIGHGVNGVKSENVMSFDYEAAYVASLPKVHTSDSWLNFTMDAHRATFTLLKPQYGDGGPMEIRCLENQDCERPDDGKAEDLTRWENKTMIPLPSCDGDTPAIELKLNELSHKDVTALVGLNLLQAVDLAPFSDYAGMDEIYENVCLLLNGHEMSRVALKSPALLRGVLAPNFHFSPVDSGDRRDSRPVCRQLEAQNAKRDISVLGGLQNGTIQLCGSVPYRFAGLVVYFNQTSPEDFAD